MQYFSNNRKSEVKSFSSHNFFFWKTNNCKLNLNLNESIIQLGVEELAVRIQIVTNIFPF